ncbi:putative transposase [Bathymodiolus platifrons methanotrophic gill symbiont]|uniref:putative transposase n=1 Tax=Bathymodiolus platifrons methanotrophic gill symbiont TaxID=113268 RepID=UPI001C8E13CD|nr:hypothetical protein [Bathymodiolus platifrons methanotrophic gill symbiont]
MARLLAFTALVRVKSIESLRYSAPGEWGKLIGLNRIPEVRTLRSKIKQLTQDEGPQQWSEALAASHGERTRGLVVPRRRRAVVLSES